MENVLSKKVSLQDTQKNLNAYFDTHDVQYLAEDATFTHMSNGERAIGRDAVGQMLHYIYHVAFDARAEIKNTIITESKAILEMDFIGKHIGEFAGIQPTNKDVNVPVCIVYDLEAGLIKHARVYMMMNIMIQQLTTQSG
jgi:predicted ester cyclase